MVSKNHRFFWIVLTAALWGAVAVPALAFLLVAVLRFSAAAFSFGAMLLVSLTTAIPGMLASILAALWLASSERVRSGRARLLLEAAFAGLVFSIPVAAFFSLAARNSSGEVWALFLFSGAVGTTSAVAYAAIFRPLLTREADAS